jgi:hypothetical protein
MQILKKQILRTTKIVTDDQGVSTLEYNLVDTYLKICLTSGLTDCEPAFISGSTRYISGVTVQSRLVELSRYSPESATTLNEKYIMRPITGGTGVVSGDSTNINYWIDDIEFNDNLSLSATTANYTGTGYTSPDFQYQPLLQDDLIVGLVENVRFVEDIFIDRQAISVFDTVFRLEHMDSILQLETYAGGGFFNIVNNI